MDRMEVLREILRDNPQDSFARYGLAMELAKQGSLEEAMSEFKHLLLVNPDYCAAYYQAGQTLEKLGKSEEAKETYKQGIEVASRLKDLKTRSELEAVLDMLE